MIVSWNTRDLLARCLESILDDLAVSFPTSAFTPVVAPVEILVVDNASTDGTSDMIRAQFPDVQLIENADNLGFARANNQAIAVSRGQYVLLLNPDTEVRPRALRTLLGFVKEHSEVGAAGPWLANPDGSRQDACEPEPTLARELWRLLHLDAVRPYARYDVERWSSGLPREVDVVKGACMLVRRDALAKIGLLDEEYFIYSEEVDLCRRLRRAGCKVFWVPSATVIHYGGRSTSQVAAPMFQHLYRGKVRYFRKHYGRTAVSAYKLILLVAAVARLALSAFAYLEPKVRRETHMALARYYFDLIRSLPSL